MIDPKGLQQALSGGKRLIIYLHDNPDPDAIAAAWLLASIGESQGLSAEMVHGGTLGRAENSAMVRLLDIPLTRIEARPPKAQARDRFALVDTQPLAGNNSFPEKLRAHVVIDHHPSREDLEAAFVDIRPDGGCTTTVLLSYHQAFGLDLSPAQATAAFYAVISETQDLGREAAKADRAACLRLFPMTLLTVLGKIRHPPREREYFKTISRAMRQVMVGKNTCICHIGSIPNAEMAAEVADLLVGMKQVSWCLVSGYVDQLMVLSIRTTHEDGRAEQVMRQVVSKMGRGGGHDMMAGGAVPCDGLASYGALTEQISKRFLTGLSRRVPENLRPLLEEDSLEGAASPSPGEQTS